MSPDQIAFKGIIFGGAFTLAGTLLANLFQVFLQWRQQKWGVISEKTKMFAEKRLNALQGAVQLCDFLDAIRPLDHLSENVRAEWVRVRRENAANSALLPEPVATEFRRVLLTLAIEPFDPARPTNVPPIVAATEKLRALCLRAIQDEFDTAEVRLSRRNPPPSL